MSIEESKNFEHPEGIVNAYEYNKTDKDGVANISKRREMEKSYVTGGIVDTEGLKWIDEYLNKNNFTDEVILSKEQVEDFNKIIDVIKDLKLDFNSNLINVECDGLINSISPELEEITNKALKELKEHLKS